MLKVLGCLTSFRIPHENYEEAEGVPDFTFGRVKVNYYSLGSYLRDSPKERREHAIFVRVERSISIKQARELALRLIDQIEYFEKLERENGTQES